MGKIIMVDIDNTITTTTGCDYAGAVPNHDNIAMMNQLYDDGHTIIYWTARGTMNKQTNWYHVTRKQLDDWNVKYHELRMEKPYFDILIDDRALNAVKHLTRDNINDIIC